MQHKHTRIYQKALELVRLAKAVVSELPPGFAFLSDQLRRASSSIVLNFSEGCAKKSPKERKRYFRIARGSTLEVMAILDVANEWEAIQKAHHEKGQDLCDHVSAMLYQFN